MSRLFIQDIQDNQSITRSSADTLSRFTYFPFHPMKVTTLTAAACAPSMAYGLIGHAWKFSSIPSGGLQDITFPFGISNAPHDRGFYFANQYNFQNVKEVGYTGLQPRADSGGQAVLHAAFSSFQGGTTSTHPNCSDGADGGAGVSCAVDVTGADYNSKWNIIVENIGGTSWRGTMVEVNTGTKTVIGEYTLPSGAGGIMDTQVGFVEYYPWNAQPSHSCSSLPKTEATFYNPTSSGGSGGVIEKPYEYGDCVGKANAKFTQASGGWTASCGF